MRVLDKNADATWSNGSGSDLKPSNLDHVVAANQIEFKKFNGVDVRGWVEEETESKK